MELARWQPAKAVRLGYLVKFIEFAARSISIMRLTVQVVETFALIVKPLRDFRLGKVIAVENLSAQSAFNLSRIRLYVGPSLPRTMPPISGSL